jgi:hypothetical protein
VFYIRHSETSLFAKCRNKNTGQTIDTRRKTSLSSARRKTHGIYLFLPTCATGPVPAPSLPHAAVAGEGPGPGPLLPPDRASSSCLLPDLAPPAPSPPPHTGSRVANRFPSLPCWIEPHEGRCGAADASRGPRSLWQSRLNGGVARACPHHAGLACVVNTVVHGHR